MTEDKPMNILKVGIDTMPAGLDRLIELHDGGKPITAEMDTEITALLWIAEPTTLTNYAWAAKTHSRRCLG